MSFSIRQMIVLTKTFIPYEQFDLDIILKVTAAIYNEFGTFELQHKSSQASNQTGKTEESPYVVCRHIGDRLLPNINLGHSDLLCEFN